MSRRATTWMGVYVLLVTAPLLALLLGPVPPGVEFWWDFSMALGFAGIAMMGVQFALTSRFKRASAPFGIDIIYFIHRYLAMFALALVLGHFVILWLRYDDILGSIDPRHAPWELTVARIALVLFTLAVVTSHWRKQLRLDYDLWRRSHVVLATLGLAAAVAHVVGVGYYTQAPYKKALWLAMTLFWGLLIGWVRLVRPVLLKRRPYRVAETREERGDAKTLVLEPVGHAGLKRFMPGQFAWLTVRRSPFSLREHPFSIASAPEQLPRVELTIKPLGDFTSSIADVKPGEAAFIDAPYGVFTIDRRKSAPGFVYIAGGVGITPMMSMLRSMAARFDKRPLWLFYANSTWEEVIFREEIEAMTNMLALTIIHVLEQAPEHWRGETGYVTKELLERHLPPRDRTALHYFLCGPKPMTGAAESALTDLGVPLDHMQTEIFDLA